MREDHQASITQPVKRLKIIVGECISIEKNCVPFQQKYTPPERFFDEFPVWADFNEEKPEGFIIRISPIKSLWFRKKVLRLYRTNFWYLLIDLETISLKLQDASNGTLNLNLHLYKLQASRYWSSRHNDWDLQIACHSVPNNFNKILCYFVF